MSNRFKRIKQISDYNLLLSRRDYTVLRIFIHWGTVQNSTIVHNGNTLTIREKFCQPLATPLANFCQCGGKTLPIKRQKDTITSTIPPAKQPINKMVSSPAGSFTFYGLHLIYRKVSYKDYLPTCASLSLYFVQTSVF